MIVDGDVTIPGEEARGDPPSPAYARVPEGATRGVVVIHEVLGRAPEIDRVVDRFAAHGYAAVAPDLFHRGRVGCMRAVVHAMKTGEDVAPVRQTRRAHAWLCEHAGLDSKHVGIIGFCFGGGFALLAGHGFGAVSANYGVVPPIERLRGLPPVIACYGDRDWLFARKPEQLRHSLSAAEVEHEIHLFPGVGHSFLTDGDRPITFALTQPLFRIRWDPSVAEPAWEMILRFFDQRLGA